MKKIIVYKLIPSSRVTTSHLYYTSGIYAAADDDTALGNYERTVG